MTASTIDELRDEVAALSESSTYAQLRVLAGWSIDELRAATAVFDLKCATAEGEPFPHPSDMSPQYGEELCGECPVRMLCLEQALRFEANHLPYGIWAGLTEDERHEIVRARRWQNTPHGRAAVTEGLLRQMRPEVYASDSTESRELEAVA